MMQGYGGPRNPGAGNDRDRYRSRSRDRFDRGDRENFRDRPERVSNWDVHNNSVMDQGSMPMPPNQIGNDYQSMQMNNMLGIPGMVMDPSMLYQMNGPMMNQWQNNQAQFIAGDAIVSPPQQGTSRPMLNERPSGCFSIIIRGLPDIIREDTLIEIFQPFGPIEYIKLDDRGFCRLRYVNEESVDSAIALHGYRIRYQHQSEDEACRIYIEYATQGESQDSRQSRMDDSMNVDIFTTLSLKTLSETIKNKEDFIESSITLVNWLERGQCNKKNVNTFYSMISSINNQIRRLDVEKMTLEEEFLTLKANFKEKFQKIIFQFEQVSRVLTAAKHKRVWDHFSKPQRRNIETWDKMNSELDNLREEYNSLFHEENDGVNIKLILEKKCEELKRDKEKLTIELESYRNEVQSAEEAAERKFEKFKAHFIAEQCLKNNTVFSENTLQSAPDEPKKLKEEKKTEVKPAQCLAGPTVEPSEARLISVITAFLLVHPFGASLDYIVSYIQSIMPNTNQATVDSVLQKYNDVFERKTTGIGANIEHKWIYVTLDKIKSGA